MTLINQWRRNKLTGANEYYGPDGEIIGTIIHDAGGWHVRFAGNTEYEPFKTERDAMMALMTGNYAFWCPDCHSRDLDQPDETFYDSETIARTMQCNDCKAVHKFEYGLMSIERVEDEDDTKPSDPIEQVKDALALLDEFVSGDDSDEQRVFNSPVYSAREQLAEAIETLESEG